jgi:cold shock CspA family protein
MENTGTIKKLFQKGFGFIEVEGRKKDLFFHAAGLVSNLEFNSLKEGDKVVFDGIEPTAKGEQAFGVNLAQ